jgi:hypothetical protein
LFAFAAQAAFVSFCLMLGIPHLSSLLTEDKNKQEQAEAKKAA